MKRLRPLLVATLVMSLAFAGCGKDDPAGPTGSGVAAPKKAAVSSDLASLVPADTVALLYIKSPKELQKKIAEFLHLIDPDLAQGIPPLDALASTVLPGASQYLDLAKPVAVAIALKKGQDPSSLMDGQGVTIILGTTDGEAALAGMKADADKGPAEQRSSVARAGDWVSLSPGPAGPGPASSGGGAAIARTAPVGDIALRIDAAALIEMFRPQIDQGLAALEQQGTRMGGAGVPAAQAQALTGFLTTMLDGARDLVDSAETLEFAVALDGGTADLRFGFIAKKGSALDIEHGDHGDLAALAGHLPDGMPAHILMRMDMGKIIDFLGPFMESSLEGVPGGADKEKAQAMIAQALDIARMIGPNFAAGLRLGEGGLQGVSLADVKDAKTYMQRFSEMWNSVGGEQAALGVMMKEGEPTKVSGIEVRTFEMAFDTEKMLARQDQPVPPEAQKMAQGAMQAIFGGNSMKMSFAAVDGTLVQTVGDASLMAGAIASIRDRKGPPAALAAAIKGAGGKPAFLMHVDLRTLATGVLQLARKLAPSGDEIPAVPDGGAIPVVIWGAHDGREYGGGISADVAGITELVQSLER
jgi:hypothetical protein